MILKNGIFPTVQWDSNGFHLFAHLLGAEHLIVAMGPGEPSQVVPDRFRQVASTVSMNWKGIDPSNYYEIDIPKYHLFLGMPMS